VFARRDLRRTGVALGRPVSTAVALIVGVPLGAIAGYFGGRVDDALMRFTEFFQNHSELRARDRAGRDPAALDLIPSSPPSRS